MEHGWKVTRTLMNTRYPIMPPELLDRYLGLLGVQRRKPSMDALCELVQTHLQRVPFENVSKLYYKKHQGLRGIPSLELFLDGIEQFHFGGTCYTNNYYLYQLLANLEYQNRLCGADMSNPDVHLVSMVNIEKREYLVDVGYAAPFLTPMPRDLTTDYTIVLGRERYVLKPQDASGCSRMELYRDGNRNHGYVAKPAPRQIHEFELVIADSYREDATFMNALLLARFNPNRSLVIHNLTVIESQGTTSSIQSLASKEELGQVVFERFGIPEEFTREVVKELGQLKDAWS
jgi:N-hydroxyarylamine O-acetyltransferase